MSDLPVWYKMAVFVRPLTYQMREGGGMEHAVDGGVSACPKIGKRRIGLLAQARALFLAAFHEMQDVADSDRFGPFCQHIAALGAAARLYKPALFEAGQDQ